MRRPSLLIGLALLLAPSFAQAMTPGCEQVLSLPSVGSAYVGKVLKRANDSLDYLDTNTPVDPIFDATTMGEVMENILSAVFAMIDRSLTLTEHATALKHNTACLAFDAFQLQCEMQKVIESTNKAIKDGKPGEIMPLQELLLFLRSSLANLLHGGTDEQYADQKWGEHYIFDVPALVWCCPEDNPANTCTKTTVGVCEENGGQTFVTPDECSFACKPPPPAQLLEPLAPMCPYNSDYLPAAGDGFGCDASIMGSSRSAYAPMGAELAAMQKILTSLTNAGAAAMSLSQLRDEIAALVAGNPLPPGPTGPPTLPVIPHQTGFGCLNVSGLCEGNSGIACTDDVQCAEHDAGNCLLPTGYCSGNVNQGCRNTAECAAAGTCIMADRPNPITTALRNPFSLDEDIITILTTFQRREVTIAKSREFPYDLKLPGEFQQNQSSQRAIREYQQQLIIQATDRAEQRIAIREWEQAQGEADAALFPLSTDGPAGMASELVDLRKATSRLAMLASEPTELRSFAKSYAYFLRRSCTKRPCSKKLEEAINIAATDACFPYTDGTFLDDTDANPRWKECAKQACVRLPGVTLDLAHCKCYALQINGPPVLAAPSAADFCVPQ